MRIVTSIQARSFYDLYGEYQRKAELLNIALEDYNNGRMKRYLCELFIYNDIEKIELIMKQAYLLKGNRKEISLIFKDLVKSILEKRLVQICF